MRTRGRTGAAIVIGLTMLGASSLVGCEGLGEVKVMIPDYSTANVRGVTLWKGTTTTGEFVPQTVYQLGKLMVYAGVEYVEYTVEDDRFQLDMPLAAPVLRDPDKPDALIVQLSVVSMGEAAIVRASTFNEAGESSLSSESAEISI
jgi:hypothetical protein